MSFFSLFVSLYVCFGCSKEPPRGDGSFEYPQQIVLMGNKKIKSELSTFIGMQGSVLFILYL